MPSSSQIENHSDQDIRDDLHVSPEPAARECEIVDVDRLRQHWNRPRRCR